jgi:hypothetical protein
MRRRHRVVPTLAAVGGIAGFLALVGRASAHGGSLRTATGGGLSVPTWLFLLTGGAVVGASFVLASFVTDRALVRGVHGWYRALPLPGAVVVGRLAAVVGVLALAAVLAVGAFGPAEPLQNFAVLFVWGGWWAGFTATTYLFGNTWPTLNPWRSLATPLDRLVPDVGGRRFPDVGAWPAVVGLLGLIWLEVVSPVADDPRLLAAVVGGYTLVTLVGASVRGPESWFRDVDPASRVFRLYGAMAPLARESGTLRLRLPGSGLVTHALDRRGAVAFVVALLWATTFDGLVTTPAWRTFAGVVVGLGVPGALLYPVVLFAGFVVFLGVFRLAIRRARSRTETYLDADRLARRFAPSLVAIAAGYHLAHYLGYFISLSPALATVAAAPLNPPIEVPLLSLPGWFETVGMAAILVGHVLAIWVAHTTAYDIFPSRIQAIRSQYPYIAVMVFYTMTSLWIIAQPEVAPP